MNTYEIKDKLNSQEYDFLRTDKHLGDNIILLTTGGSHSYGTNIDTPEHTSDLDIRGIAIENINEIIGLSNFEQFINEATDTTVYGLRKVLGLMLNCNPNVIEMLGTKDEHIFVCNEYGQLLRDNVDLFLSKKAINSFGGYAFQQLKRLENALVRDSYPKQRKEEHILGTIENQLRSVEDRYKSLTFGNLNLHIENSDKLDYETEIFMDIKLQNYPLRDFKNIYSEMNNIIRDYDKLNHRNSKKDEQHLNKHCLHLVRLFLMGIEILEGKGVNTYREKDIPLLMDIRKGKYKYEEIFQMADDLQKKFKYASDNSPLPTKPNYKKVEELLMSIYMEAINGK